MQATESEETISFERIVPMETPADLANATHLSHDEAERIETLAFKRAARRDSGRFDVIVVLEPWAKTYPSRSDPIGREDVLLVGRIEDYSDKAYKCRGAFWVDLDYMMNLTDEAMEEAETIDLLYEPDEYDNNPTLKYLPKSAVEAIAVIQ